MAYNSRHKKQSKLNASFNEDDDYVYPTKKGRENKTRNRRSDANLIQAGLIDHRYQNNEDNSDQEIMDDYNDMVMGFNEARKEAKQSDDNFYNHLDDDYDDAVNDIYVKWDIENSYEPL